MIRFWLKNQKVCLLGVAVGPTGTRVNYSSTSPQVVDAVMGLVGDQQMSKLDGDEWVAATGSGSLEQGLYAPGGFFLSRPRPARALEQTNMRWMVQMTTRS